MDAVFHRRQKHRRPSSRPHGRVIPAHSGTLALTAYNLILMWPLSVRDRGDGTMPDDGVDRICKAVEKASHWTKVQHRLHHLRASSEINAAAKTISKDEYAEFVYFYPFVQNFLFGDNDHIRLYRRTDIDAVRVAYQVNDQDRTITLKVPRLNLYVFATGDVFLVTEVSVENTDDFTLQDAMVLNERLRRAYPPFFYQDDSLDHSYTLDSVEWLRKDKPLAQEKACPRDFLGEVVAQAGTPARNPLYPHWRFLLPDLKPVGLRWRQVQDDRMPAVAAIALDRPDKISRPDWVRLANFDDPGDSSSYGYGEAFLETFEQDCCYDRFWHPVPGDWRMTRYVSTGFAFTQVLKADGGGYWKPYFHHQRSLYFTMALISHFHQAALQNLSDQMAHAMLKEPDSKGSGQIGDIMRRMLKFTQAFWFTDVSNQLQARELFRLIRRPLELEALYGQVSSEAREANAYLNRLEDQRIADATERFNKIAVAGVVVAGATGFLGMNVWVEGWKDLPGWLVFLLSLVFFAFSAGILWTQTSKKGFSLPEPCQKYIRRWITEHQCPGWITRRQWLALGLPLVLIALLALFFNKPPAEAPTVPCHIVEAPSVCPAHPSSPKPAE